MIDLYDCLINFMIMQVLETEHGTQGFYIDISPVHRSVRVIIDERYLKRRAPNTYVFVCVET